MVLNRHVVFYSMATSRSPTFPVVILDRTVSRVYWLLKHNKMFYLLQPPAIDQDYKLFIRHYFRLFCIDLHFILPCITGAGVDLAGRTTSAAVKIFLPPIRTWSQCDLRQLLHVYSGYILRFLRPTDRIVQWDS